jgi:hypothetical protein
METNSGDNLVKIKVLPSVSDVLLSAHQEKKATSASVIAENDPFHLTLGYRVGDFYFCCSLVTLKKAVSEGISSEVCGLLHTTSDAIMEMFKTPEGRQQIADML